MSWWLLPSAVAVVALAGFSVFLFVRRPPAPLWPVAPLCQVAALVWVSGDLLTYFASNSLQKQLALAFLFTGSLFLPSLWWVTAVRYTRSHHLPWKWIRSRWAMLPAAVGIITWLVMISNPWHGRFLTPVVGARSEYSALANGLVILCFALIPGASALFLGLSRRVDSRDVQRSSLILAFSALAPLIVSSTYFFSNWQIPIDPVCIGLSAACGAMIWGTYRTGLFSLLPVALPEVMRHDPNGVLLLGDGGRLLHWNPAAERILAPMRLAPELDFFRVLLPELRDAVHDAVVSESPVAFAQLICDSPRTSTSQLYRLRGKDRFVRITASRVPTRRGRLAALALRIEDVTRLQRLEQERRDLENEVRHAEKLKSLGLLAGGIAHDFNNLLGSILGNTSLALRADVSTAILKENLEEVEAAAKQASELTLQLLAYGGNAPSSPTRVDVSRLVAEMARLLEVSVAGRATLHVGDSPAPTVVHADAAQLRQIVLNLVTNAAEAVEERGCEGVVELRIRCVDVTAPGPRLAAGRLEPRRHVVIEVADTGIGMPAEVRARIFDPFFSTRREGRGLGMAVVFGCVQALDGGIEIEGEPGTGTTLRIYLPEAIPQHGETVAKEPTRREDESWRGGGTVLVVDDQPRMLRALAAILRHAGFEILTASSGSEAIQCYRGGADSIRLVLLDVTLPDVSGEEVLREIRSINPDARVILASGFAESHVMARMASTKFAAFVQKPFDSRELLQCVRRVIEEEIS